MAEAARAVPILSRRHQAGGFTFATPQPSPPPLLPPPPCLVALQQQQRPFHGGLAALVPVGRGWNRGAKVHVLLLVAGGVKGRYVPL